MKTLFLAPWLLLNRAAHGATFVSFMINNSSFSVGPELVW